METDDYIMYSTHALWPAFCSVVKWRLEKPGQVSATNFCLGLSVVLVHLGVGTCVQFSFVPHNHPANPKQSFDSGRALSRSSKQVLLCRIMSSTALMLNMYLVFS